MMLGNHIIEEAAEHGYDVLPPWHSAVRGSGIGHVARRQVSIVPAGRDDLVVLETAFAKRRSVASMRATGKCRRLTTAVGFRLRRIGLSMEAALSVSER